ncbi:hypothetical protein Lal_00011041 [Lupinus albus]|uniref:Uncharacterized protein n=1 Tax=Lupinus albus TaxID=3870 RepID=A0A6A4PSL2_LUPAL|nr:hypothetical protein Lalb_Chr11g0073691 [Lupinus albus]KAF1892574.1 hypothetical protein Lal_00011041 [Lupinus albus]
MGSKRSSFFSLLKACFSSGSRYEEGSGNRRRIFASDEDRGYWIAEPDIDMKASDFIARYYATRVTDSEHQFVS